MHPQEDHFDTLPQELQSLSLKDLNTTTLNSVDEVFPFDDLPHELQLLCLKDFNTATLNSLRATSRRHLEIVDGNGFYHRKATITIHLEADELPEVEIDFPKTQYLLCLNNAICYKVVVSRPKNKEEGPRAVKLDNESAEEMMQLLLRGTEKRDLLIYGTLTKERLESMEFLLEISTYWHFRFNFDGVTDKEIMQIVPRRPMGIHGGYKVDDVEQFVRDAGIGTLRFYISEEATLSNENLQVLTMRDDLEYITVSNVRGPGPATIRKLIENQLKHFPSSNKLISLTFRHDVTEYSRDDALKKNGNGVTVHLIKNANICTMLDYETSKAKLGLRIMLRTLELQLGKANKKF